MKALQEYSVGCAIGAGIVAVGIAAGLAFVWVYEGLKAMAAPL